MTNTGGTPAGWYHAPGDPDGTQRYWDGAQWIGEPQAASPQAAPQAPQAPLAPQAPASGQPPQFSPPPQGAGAPPGYQAYGAPGAENLAEPWQRLVARLIDAIIVGIVNIVIGVIVAVALDNVLGGIIASLIGVAIGLAYEIILTTKADATLGKKIFNMRIVNEADGSRVDEQVMFRRMLPIVAIGVIGAVPILGLLSIPLGLAFVVLSLVWIFSDDKRRSVYDKAGKTIVIVES